MEPTEKGISQMLPKSLTFFRHRSVFVKWLLILNIVILLSIIIVGSVSYMTSSSLLIEEAEKTSGIYLEQARDNIDNEIMVLESLTQQIALQPDTRRALYLSSKGDTNDATLFFELVKYLSTVKFSNPMISSLWLDPRNYPSIISNDAKYEKSFFYQSVFPLQPDFDWSRTGSKMFGVRSLGKVEINGKTELLFARPAPIEEQPYRGVIYVSVDAQDFAARINSSKFGASNGVFVMNAEQNIVLKNDWVQQEHDDPTLNQIVQLIQNQPAPDGSVHFESSRGDLFLVVYTSSKVNDWKYVSMIPIATIMEQSKRIQSVTAIAVMLCLACGLVVSYVLTRRIYEPINNIIQFIKLTEGRLGTETGSGAAQKQDELTFINQLINTVHDRYESLKTAFDNQVPALQHKFLNDIIEGQAPDSIVETAAGIRLQLPYTHYQIAVFESVGFTLNERASSDETVLEVFDDAYSRFSAAGTCVYYVPKHNNMLVTIIHSESGLSDPDTVYEFAGYINETFERLYNRKFTVGIGQMYNSHLEVPLSYVDALSALQYKVVKGQGKIIFVDEVRQPKANTLIYPMDLEKQLTNQLKTSEIGQVKGTLDSILAMNINVQQSSPELIQNLFKALAGTAIRTIYDIEATTEEIFDGPGFDLYSEIDKCKTINEKRHCILEAFTTICRYIQQRNENQYEQLFKKIKDYVENFYHQELSLPQLGEALKMSPTYLSSKFREITGMKFVDFVNLRRIEQAKRYLMESDDAVNSISEKVGFVNANTFIKVFKKHEGITPGQYRTIKQ
jgi:two-component system response regulator YesN